LNCQLENLKGKKDANGIPHREMPSAIHPTPINTPAMQGHVTQPNTRDVSMSAHQCPLTPRKNNQNLVLTTSKPKMRANINIATLNMNSLVAPTNNMSYTEKWSMINQTLNKYKIV
jgi:hypothetical protein